MRAIQFDRYGPTEVLELREVERPQPRAGEVRVQVCAAAVNPADHYLMRGRPYLIRLAGGLQRPKVHGLGLDFAGVVDAVGAGVDTLAPGDAVFGEVEDEGADACRAFAEYTRVAAGIVARKPAGVSFAEAAALPVAARTALCALRDHGRLQPGEHVLINGAGGGVGTFAVQLARHFGARVSAVCSGGKAELMRTLGADQVIDYEQTDLSAGRERYDLIVDIIGSRSPAQCRRVLAPRGRFVWVGASLAAGPWLGPLHAAARVMLASVRSGGQQWTCAITPKSPADLELLAGLLDAGTLRAVIDRRYPLECVDEAIRYLERGHATGKIVIEI